MKKLYPLLIEPTLSQRLWGGERLAEYLHLREVPAGDPVGEAWLVYAENSVRNGVHAGKTLQRLADRFGPALLGTVPVARYGSKVPLLAKFIDAADRLSIQVHPDDSYALTHERDSGHLGKTEAWYVLAADPGATIIWGFARPVTAEEVRRAVADGTLEPYLRTVEVAPGDVIYNPAGVVHAIGAGIFLYEIQQSSDLTYRLYDYNRRDATGRLRDLHLDKALAVARLEPDSEPKIEPIPLSDGWRQLIRVEPFAMEVRRFTGDRVERQTQPSSLELLTVLSGLLELDAAGELLALPQGASVVLPAAMGRYRLAGAGEVVRCYVPAPD